MKIIPIFKPGTHIASDGTRITFTQADVEGMVTSYDTALHEAPIVVGHPKDNTPAFGWVGGLSYSDELGQVVATPRGVMPEFEEAVEAGRYKKRSASLYPPDSPNNPVPGSYYLRHVGFLGGQPPAIKGLSGIEYAEDTTVIEFADPQVVAYGVANLFRRIRDWLIAEKGLDVADAVVPAWNVEDLEAEARKEIPENPTKTALPGFTENTEVSDMDQTELKAAQDQLAADQAALAASKAEMATNAAAFAEEQAGLKKDRLNVVATGMAAAGKIPAAQAGQVADFMATLPDGVEITFGEGDAKKSQPALQWFKEFVESRPAAKPANKNVDLGEVTDDGQISPQELSAKILAYQEKALKETGQEVSIVDAVQAIQTAAAE